MKTKLTGILTIVYLFASIQTSYPQQNSNVPENIDLNGNWKFAYTPEFEGEQPTIPGTNQFVAEMPVPAYWDDCYSYLEDTEIWNNLVRNPDYEPVDFSTITHEKQAYTTKALPYIIGVGFYRKEIFIPEDWKNKSAILQLGGVSQQAWIFVNGKLAGKDFNYSTGFEIPIHDFLNPGEDNEIIIAVSNLGEVKEGFLLAGYQGKSAGIPGSINLKITGESRIKSCYVFPSKDMKSLKWEALLDSNNNELENLSLRWEVVDPVTQKIVDDGTVIIDNKVITWKLSGDILKTWSDRTPNLYDLELTLFQDDQLIDSFTHTFGKRRLTSKGIDLYLNGDPIYLRGVTDHCYWALTCTPPITKNDYIDVIKKLQSVGFNWIRFHTWVPNEQYMQAADELGMLMMVEAPYKCNLDEWEDIFKTCRVHPSVVLYSGGNEQLLDEKEIEYLGSVAQLQKKIVPDALFNPQEALRGIEYYWKLSDLGEDTVGTPFLHNRKRVERLKEFSDVFGQYGWGYLSYFSERGDSKMLNERMVVYERPCLSHEVGIKGNYINLDHECRMNETRIGADRYKSAKKLLRENGLLDRAPVYYENSCEWLRTFRKQAIETVRKTKYYRGYDFLGGHDHNAHRGGYEAGIFNEFFELKPGNSVDDLLKYNNESVLLIDNIPTPNFKPGDIFVTQLMLSHWGKDSIKDGRISWYLNGRNNEVLLRGSMKIDDIAPGTLTELAEISFSIPQLTESTKLKLIVELSSSNYELTNDWNLWGFTDQSLPVGELKCDEEISNKFSSRYNFKNDVVDVTIPQVVGKLDSSSIDYLKNGGTVVLLGNNLFPSRDLSYTIGLAGRTHGNLATIIANHPIMNGFPHDGWCDEQFRDMFNDASTVVFTDLDISFEPIIEVVSGYKFIIKQSCLFELKVGNGRLIVCTLNFDLNDPAGMNLLNNIIGYAGNMKQHKPVPKVSTGFLIELMNKNNDATMGSDNESIIDKANKENKQGNIKNN